MAEFKKEMHVITRSCLDGTFSPLDFMLVNEHLESEKKGLKDVQCILYSFNASLALRADGRVLLFWT